MQKTKAHGYENSILILVALAILAILFAVIAHQLQMNIAPNLHTLFDYLKTN